MKNGYILDNNKKTLIKRINKKCKKIKKDNKVIYEIEFNSDKITFNNIEFKKEYLFKFSDESNIEFRNCSFENIEIIGGNVIYNNCIFNKEVNMKSKNTSFNNINCHEKRISSLKIESDKVIFNDCEGFYIFTGIINSKKLFIKQSNLEIISFFVYTVKLGLIDSNILCNGIKIDCQKLVNQKSIFKCNKETSKINFNGRFYSSKVNPLMDNKMSSDLNIKRLELLDTLNVLKEKLNNYITYQKEDFCKKQEQEKKHYFSDLENSKIRKL